VARPPLVAGLRPRAHNVGMPTPKATWTSHDLPAMSWRGCKIHGIHIGRYKDDSTGEGFLDECGVGRARVIDSPLGTRKVPTFR